MTIKEIYPNIHCVYALNNKTLGSTFLRFQEFYESPEFRDKIFTLKQYKKWYKKYMKEKTFSYYSYFVGFNVPDIAFEPFLQGKFNPLSKNEKILLNYVANLKPPFYIIGVCINDKKFVRHLEHESSHALWYLDNRYQKYMLRQINNFSKNLIKNLQRKLRENGYHKKVYNDEIHAYMVNTCNPVYTMLSEVKRMKKYYHKTYDKHIIIKDDVI